MKDASSPARAIGRIVVTGDTHLGFDLPLRPRAQHPRRGEDFFRNFEIILKYALSSGAAYLIHGGDLFFRSKVPQAIVDRVYRLLAEYADRGLTLLIVPGNHERSVLPASLYRFHPRIKVLERPEHFILDLGGMPVAVGGFPSVGNGVRQVFPKLLQRTGLLTARARLKILCLHEAVEGARVGPSHFTFRDRPDTIRLADLPEGLSLVVSGHIHRAQVLRKIRPDSSRLEILYPGSVERTSFAEKDEEKGFWELEIHDSFIRKKFHSLPARPMVLLDCPRFSGFEAFSNWVAGEIRLLDPGSIVRLRPAGSGVTLPEGFSLERLRKTGPQTLFWEISGKFYQKEDA